MSSKKIKSIDETRLNYNNDFLSTNNNQLDNLYNHLDFYKKTFNNFQILNKSTLSYVHSLQAENQLLKNQIKEYDNRNIYLNNIGKTKSYKFAYFIRRFFLEFIKGSKKEKYNFFKWFKSKILRKNYKDESEYSNPLLDSN